MSAGGRHKRGTALNAIPDHQGDEREEENEDEEAMDETSDPLYFCFGCQTDISEDFTALGCTAKGCDRWACRRCLVITPGLTGCQISALPIVCPEHSQGRQTRKRSSREEDIPVVDRKDREDDCQEKEEDDEGSRPAGRHSERKAKKALKQDGDNYEPFVPFDEEGEVSEEPEEKKTKVVPSHDPDLVETAQQAPPSTKKQEEPEEDDDDEAALDDLEMMEGPRSSEAKAKRAIPGPAECMRRLREEDCLSEKMERKLRYQLVCGKEAASSAYQHIWTAMLTAELWRAQDLLDFCILTDELRQFLEGKVAEGVTSFSIGRSAIGDLAPEAVTLMTAVRKMVETQLNDSRLKEDFFKTKKDGKGQHKTVLFDLDAAVGETAPDIRVDFTLFEILKCLALGLPSIMATVDAKPLTCDCEMACDLLGIPKIYWARVRQYRAVQWCVIVVLIIWQYGMWPERSGLALVHVAREGDLYLAEDKQQRDSSKGGNRQTEQSRAIEDEKARGRTGKFTHRFKDGTIATLDTATGTQHSGGSADYDYAGTGNTTAGGATSTRAGKSNGGHQSRDTEADHGCKMDDEIYVQVKLDGGPWVWGGRADQTPLTVNPRSWVVELSMSKFKKDPKHGHDLISLRDEKGDSMSVRVMSKRTFSEAQGQLTDGQWTGLEWLEGPDYPRSGRGSGKYGRWNLREVVQGWRA